jgi:FkbM family methyltransferase
MVGVAMLRKIFHRLDHVTEYLRIRWALYRNEPVPFTYEGRQYVLNPDQSSLYHIRESTAKIANMTHLIDSDARVIFDVGANCGLFSAFAADVCPDSLIYCFEPAMELIPIIQKNVQGKHVQIRNLAVGDKKGRRSLYINRSSQQTNSFNRDAVALFVNPNDIEVRDVDCVTLDEFIAEHQLSNIDVLKVDVQGYEAAVFRGARNLLAEVQQIFVESTWMDLESVVGVIPFALEYGFRYLAVVNPVYMGCDLLLSRREIQGASVKLSFEITSDTYTRGWI